VSHLPNLYTKLLQYVLGQPPLLLKQSEQDMLHIPLAVLIATHQLLRESQRFLSLFRKSILSHHLVLPVLV
jgi:hypothetical protein